MAGTAASVGVHFWVASICAVITVTVFRFSTEDASGPQIIRMQADGDRPVLISPKYFLANSGLDDAEVIARSSDVGKDWQSGLLEPGDLALGSDFFVADSEFAATAAFMALGPAGSDAGMFGSRTHTIARLNALAEQRSFERESALRVALSWIVRQHERGEWYKNTEVRPAPRSAVLAMAALMRSDKGVMSNQVAVINRTIEMLGRTNLSREDQPFMIWAMQLRHARLNSPTVDQIQPAVTRLLDQQGEGGGWRSSQQHEGLIDARITAWSLFAVRAADDADVDSSASLLRAAGWLEKVHQELRLSAGQHFPLVWDSVTGHAVGPETDQLWGAFAVLMLDLPEQSDWCDELIAEVTKVPCDDRLFADPERLLVHTLIRVRARTPGCEAWLHQIESRLSDRQRRRGDDAGSWDPPAQVERLDFAIWSALALHEAYAF